MFLKMLKDIFIKIVFKGFFFFVFKGFLKDKNKRRFFIK